MGRILDLLDRIGKDGASRRRLHSAAKSVHSHLEREIAIEDALTLDEPLIAHDAEGRYVLTTAGIAVRENGMEPNPKRLGMPSRALSSAWLVQHTKAGRVVPEHLLDSQSHMLGLEKEGIVVIETTENASTARIDRIRTPMVEFTLDRRLRQRDDVWEVCLRIRDAAQAKGPAVLLPEYLSVASLLVKADLDRLEERAGDAPVIGIVVESGSPFADALSQSLGSRLQADVLVVDANDEILGFDADGDAIALGRTFG